MALGYNEIRNRATTFAFENKDKTYEMGESQTFWNDFFEVFGVNRKRVATFEQAAKKATGTKGRIDVFWPGVLLIEQKSRGQNLDKAYKQATDYFPGLEDHELPRFILVCDFHNFHLYDLHRQQEHTFTLSEFPNKIELFGFITGQLKERLTNLDVVSIQAAEKMAKLYDKLKEIGYQEEALKQYLVRLLFCLFADDTSIFEPSIFHELVASTKEDGSDLAITLRGLFERLNTPFEERLKIEDPFSHFPYVNGSLFKDMLPIAAFDEKMRKILLDACTFDWGHITPSIFGSMFQAAMSETDRRTLGAHYTEENNILKVINPLFMNELKKEFELVKTNTRRLNDFHNKLANLRFLDPACGTGNFLIIAYRELRRLELEVIEALAKLEKSQNITLDDHFDATNRAKIKLNQFYGIEIDQLAVEIAKVGMWLVDHQCNMELSAKFGQYYARLPLADGVVVVQANALQVDWLEAIGASSLDYIFGNPPFLGAKAQSKEQKSDLLSVLIERDSNPIKNNGTADYVVGWYYKSAQIMIKNKHIHTALVSTNSIIQGELTSVVWKSLMEDYGVNINFGYRTFKWNSQARGQAAVHCVIVGFSLQKTKQPIIFDGELEIQAKNINGYLVDAPNIFIDKRKLPLADVPMPFKGNEMYDDKNLVIEANEYEDFITKEPLAEKWIRQYTGSDEFINNKMRYCLWLVDCSPGELKQMPYVLERVRKVKEFRLKSNREATRKTADTPTTFSVLRQPTSNFILMPVVSSENRKYIPMGYLSSDIIVSYSAFTLENATLYHFGVLTSSIHMAWVRTVCGRLKSDYRYSKDIVYNNFPWPGCMGEQCSGSGTTSPGPTDKQREAIEKAAQAVLDARAMFPDDSLATLYDPTTMPPVLAKAHTALDKAVAKAYDEGTNHPKGFATEAERVADLMERYQKLVDKKK